LFAASRSPLVKLAEDEGRYVQFLEGIIVQGFLQVMEPSVIVHTRKRDVALGGRAAESAAKHYQELIGKEILFEIEGTLSDDSYVPILGFVSPLMGLAPVELVESRL